MKQKDKNLNKVILALTVILAGICLSAFAYKMISRPLEINTVEIKFTVGENIGFDLNKTALTLGKIVPGGSAERRVIIGNDREFPVEVWIFASKSIADYISLEKESFIIEPKGRIEVLVKAVIPRDMELGDYSGKILFKIYKAK